MTDRSQSAPLDPSNLRSAASALISAAEMLEHNDAIFVGKWKKGSKAWSGEFIDRTIKDALAFIPQAAQPSERLPTEQEWEAQIFKDGPSGLQTDRYCLGFNAGIAKARWLLGNRALGASSPNRADDVLVPREHLLSYGLALGVLADMMDHALKLDSGKKARELRDRISQQLRSGEREG